MTVVSQRLGNTLDLAHFRDFQASLTALGPEPLMGAMTTPLSCHVHTLDSLVLSGCVVVGARNGTEGLRAVRPLGSGSSVD